jgi:hypothetical protein
MTKVILPNKKGSSLQKPQRLNNNTTIDFKNIEEEEDELLKKFEKMEKMLKLAKVKQEKVKNVEPKPIIEIIPKLKDKSKSKSKKAPAPKKKYEDCLVQTKTTVYNLDGYEGSNQSEYMEVKKTYRQCPKSNKKN